MIAIQQILTLKAKAEKELAQLKKSRDAAKAKAEKALTDYKDANQKYEKALAALGLAPTQDTESAAPKAAKVKAAPAQASGVRLRKDGTPAKRPGPPKGTPRGSRKAPAPVAPAAPAAPKAAKVKAPKAAAQAAPAPVAPAAPTKAAKGQKTRAAEGRRAVMRGERPMLKDALKSVMGTATMNSAEIFDQLQEKGWVPNSKDPKTYIGYSLSSMKKDFEPVPDKGRGYYRVRPSLTNGAGASTPAGKDATLEDAKALLGVVN